MAGADVAFVQKILHVPKQKREPNIHHERKTDDFRRRLEVLEWVAFCHSAKLSGCPAHLNQFCSDSAVSINRQIIEDGLLTTLRQIKALWRFVS